MTIDLHQFSVLEIGCGIGGLLFKMLDLGAKECLGVDISDNMITSAKEIAKSLGYQDKTIFIQNDFNLEIGDGIFDRDFDIVIADRVLCCSPRPIDVLEKILKYNPKYIVISQPRKNLLYRFILQARIKIRQRKLKVKRHEIAIPYVGIAEYDKICSQSGLRRVLQKYRFSWEVVVYKKEN